MKIHFLIEQLREIEEHYGNLDVLMEVLDDYTGCVCHEPVDIALYPQYILIKPA